VTQSVWRLGYRLDDQGAIPGRDNDGNFSLHHSVQTGSGAHPASYPMGIQGSYLGSKAAGAWKYHSLPTRAKVKNAWSYTVTPQQLFLEWYLVTNRDNFTFHL
jgi:hypothetical protein